MKLRRAAKARISRMVAPKSRRKELTAPDFVRKEWEEGNKNAMADLLQRVNFEKDPFWICGSIVFRVSNIDTWPINTYSLQIILYW